MEFATNLLKRKDLRNKIGVLLLCLLIYKIGMHITVPGINRELLESMSESGGALSLINSFTGGALYNFSIFAVGIMPYITASIIIQLLQMDIVSKLVEWKNQGEDGRKKIKKLTYVLSILLSIIQSVGMSFSFNKMYPGLLKEEDTLSYILIASILTLGTIILIFLGEIIDKKGIGKGISMIILAGILMTLPNTFAMYYDMEFTNVGEGLFISIVKTLLLILFAYALLVTIIIVNGAARRIPIHSSRNGEFGKASFQKSFLPVKINASGVIPIIFASALIMLPTTVSQFTNSNNLSNFINNYISYTSITGMVLYGLLIIGFTYFYTFIQMDPKVISDNLKNGNTFIPSIRPGTETEDYLKRVLKRLTLVGSLFLAVISILPMVLSYLITLPQQLVFGGTSLIIVVSVIVDLDSQIVSQMVTNRYKGFLK